MSPRARLALLATGLVLASKGCWSDTKEVMGWGRPRWWGYVPEPTLLAALLLVLVMAAVVAARRRWA